jgi:hypothetical protein
MGLHPWPASLCKITFWNTCALSSKTLLPRRPQTNEMSALLLSLRKLTSLCTAEAWGVAHFTFEHESLLCFLLANLGQLSTCGPPGLRLWLMYAHYLSKKCCYQNSGFPYLLFLCRHSCWVMHPQPHHLLSVLSWWYIYFNPIYHPWEQWPEVWSFTSTGELISWTQVYNPDLYAQLHHLASRQRLRL